MSTNASSEERTQIPLFAVVLVLIALTPFAMYFGIASVSASDQNAFPYGLGIAALLLSISGSALRPSAAGHVGVATFSLTVVAPFILWLFTSSIGGVAPGPVGALLGAVGSCAGILTSRLQIAKWIPLLTWVPVLVLGATHASQQAADRRAKDMNAETASPSFVAGNVLPKLVVNAPQVSWMELKYGPGHAETGGEFIASGQFIKANGGIGIYAFDDTARYSITIDTTSPYQRGDLRSDIDWLRNQNVRVSSLSNIQVNPEGWSASGPDNIGRIEILRRSDHLTIGGVVKLPPAN